MFLKRKEAGPSSLSLFFVVATLAIITFVITSVSSEETLFPNKLSL